MVTLLYVEDQCDEELVEVLKDEGFRVVHVSDGESAVKALGKQPFEVVLLDIMMAAGNDFPDYPDIDGGFRTGLGLLRFMEQQGFHIPVVVLSANPSREVRDEAEGSSLVHEFISKGGKTSLIQIIAALHRAVKEGKDVGNA